MLMKDQPATKQDIEILNQDIKNLFTRVVHEINELRESIEPTVHRIVNQAIQDNNTFLIAQINEMFEAHVIYFDQKFDILERDISDWKHHTIKLENRLKPAERKLAKL